MIMKKFKDEMPDYNKRVVVLFEGEDNYDLLTEQDSNLVVCVLKKRKSTRNSIKKDCLIEVTNTHNRRIWFFNEILSENIQNSQWMYM